MNRRDEPRPRPRAGRRLVRQWAGLCLLLVALGCFVVPLPPDVPGEVAVRAVVAVVCTLFGAGFLAE